MKADLAMKSQLEKDNKALAETGLKMHNQYLADNEKTVKPLQQERALLSNVLRQLQLRPTKFEIETLNVCGKTAVAKEQVPVAKTDGPVARADAFVAKMVADAKQTAKKTAAKG